MERFDEKDGVWRTVNGQHIFIRDGEDVETAMRRQGMRRGNMSKEELSRLKRHGRKEIAREIDKRNEEDFKPRNMREYEHNGRKIKIYDHRGNDPDAPVDGRIASWGKQQARDKEDYEFWKREEEYYKKYHNVK